MSTVIETDLKQYLEEFKREVVGRIDNLHNNLTGKIDNLHNDFTEFKRETNQRLDNLQKDVGELKIELAKVSEKLEGIDKRVGKLEGTQTTQLWALIVLLVGAFVKFGFFPNT